MDNILDETASRWDGLTRAQKMAFAETAAGTMQYTKLVSLMDNWDDMQKISILLKMQMELLKNKLKFMQILGKAPKKSPCGCRIYL